MSEERSVSVSVGPGTISVMLIVLLGLKVAGYQFSWWWFLAPFALPVVVVAGVILCVLWVLLLALALLAVSEFLSRATRPRIPSRF